MAELCVPGQAKSSTAYSNELLIEINKRSVDLRKMSYDLQHMISIKLDELVGCRPEKPLDEGVSCNPDSWAAQVINEQAITYRLLQEALNRLSDL